MYKSQKSTSESSTPQQREVTEALAAKRRDRTGGWQKWLCSNPGDHPPSSDLAQKVADNKDQTLLGVSPGRSHVPPKNSREMGSSLCRPR